MYSEDNDNSWEPPPSPGAEDSHDSFDSDDNDGDGWPKAVFNKNIFHDGVPEEYQPSSAFVPPGDTHQVTQAKTQQPCLRMTRQPEEQHRARYLSEGSRGAIKDRSGTSHCAIQMVGYSRPTRLEIFAGTGAGPVAPHPLYRTIPVTGKGGSSLTTPCREVISADGIACLEVTLRPEFGMTAVLDCVGILKICTYNVKRRLPKGSKNSSVRLVFRATIPNPACHTQPLVIQTESAPIVCVQQLGLPEVLKMSLQSATCRGGVDLFIIGRNFDRNTAVVFREYKEDGKLAWSAEATMDRRLLHQCHLVCSLPTYRDLSLTSPVEVSMTIKCGRKSSHPLPFYYTAESSSYDWAPPTTPVAVTNPSNQQMSSGGTFTFPPVIPPKTGDRGNNVMAPVPNVQHDDLGSIADLFSAHDALFNPQLAATNVPPQPPRNDESLNGGMLGAPPPAPIDWDMPQRKRVKHHKSS